MKRFTETSKWGDPWWRRLSSPAKQLQGYLWDNCNQIGLIEVDFTLVSGDCGQKIDAANMAELGERVQSIGAGKYFLPKFIHFQYGELSEECRPHRPIIRLIGQHGLERSGLIYIYPTSRVLVLPRQDKKGQDKTVQEPETSNKAKGTQAEIKDFCIETGLSEDDSCWVFDKWEGNGWKNDGKTIKDWRATIRAWKRSGIFPSQKQSGNGHVSGAGLIVMQKEYERVVERMKIIRSNYGDHQAWDERDKLEFQTLKSRKQILKENLGITI